MRRRRRGIHVLKVPYFTTRSDVDHYKPFQILPSSLVTSHTCIDQPTSLPSGLYHLWTVPADLSVIQSPRVMSLEGRF